MNLHLLRIFYTVVEQQSFSGAAAALFISQPAVSKGVRELEHQLGLPLIERGAKGAKGVRLTESGTALYDHARGIFALERAAQEDVQARVGLRRGRLAVGASTTIAGYWLPAFTASFMQQYPAIELHVVTGNTQAIAQTLINCDIDIALVEGPVQDPRISATHWRDDELQIVAAPASPLARARSVAAAELNEQLWLLREPGSGTREVTEALMRTHAIEPRRSIEFGANEGIARCVAAGLGVAMLPARVVRELILVEEVKALRLAGAAALMRPLFLLQSRDRPPSPLVNAFCRVLQ